MASCQHYELSQLPPDLRKRWERSGGIGGGAASGCSLCKTD